MKVADVLVIGWVKAWQIPVQIAARLVWLTLFTLVFLLFVFSFAAKQEERIKSKLVNKPHYGDIIEYVYAGRY